MDTTKTSVSREYHIDGMKGLLCFCIMLGHFWMIYSMCQDRSAFSSPLLDTLGASYLGSYLFSANFWLYAFFVISGYLLSNTNIRNPLDLIIKSAKRFLRFFIPIFGACLFIYLIQETVGFHANATKAYFSNSWFQGCYAHDLDWRSIYSETVRALFSGFCIFNEPYWVIRDMFQASLGIYVCNFADSVFRKKLRIFPFVGLFFALRMNRPFIIACMAGYLVGYYKTVLQKLAEKKYAWWAIYAAALAAIFYWRASVQAETFLTWLWSFLLITVNYFSCLQKFFSTKPFLFMGKISFGVFSFHWPVICSFGSLALITGLENQWSPEISLLFCLVCSIWGTVLISLLYNVTVEKLTVKITNLFHLFPSDRRQTVK